MVGVMVASWLAGSTVRLSDCGFNWEPSALGAAVLVPDKKLDRFCLSQKFSLGYQNNLAYHPGLVLPPGGDGSPLQMLKGYLSSTLSGPKWES